MPSGLPATPWRNKQTLETHVCMQIDQVYKVCAVLGCPTPDSWPEGLDRAGQLGWSFPQFAPTPLTQLVPNASVEAISLMTALCQWDPARRPTASQALAHPFFQVEAPPEPPPQP